MDVGDINVEMDEPNESVVRQLIEEVLMSRVFKYIDEKRAIIQNRKTWNLKR